MLALILVTLPIHAADLAGRASVIDGDTLEIHGTRIRLHGIDAPEARQSCEDRDGKPWRCGQAAALALSDRLSAAHVRCEPKDRDRYGRTVAVCYLGAVDINGWLVASGWAVAYRQYSRDYVDEEQTARDAGTGVWQGRFTMPERWRRGERLSNPAAPGN